MVTYKNWREIFRTYMLVEVFKKNKKGKWIPEIDHYDYVWQPAVMEDFIEALIKSLKKNVGAKRTTKRNK
jgi:hypothetical protein